MVPKAWWSKEKRASYWSPAEWVAREQRYRMIQWKKKFAKPENPEKRKDGYIYFFESVTRGWFKAGRTGNWKARQTGYSGPSAIKKVFFVRAVSDMWKAEEQLLAFLDAHGYHRKHKKTEWFTRELGDSFSLTLAKP